MQKKDGRYLLEDRPLEDEEISTLTSESGWQRTKAVSRVLTRTKLGETWTAQNGSTDSKKNALKDLPQ